MRIGGMGLFVLASAPLMAATLGLTGTGLSTAIDAQEYTTGWAFTTSGVLSVTALGYFDAGGDGLSSFHDVGIFSSGGTLLVSATVPSGTAGTLNGDWRMVAITPYLLPAGSYVIGGANHGSVDPGVYESGSVTGAPGVTLGNLGLYDWATGLAFPTQSAASHYLSPNFEFGSAAIPEPATALVAGAALAAGALLRRRRN